jgi:ABC-type transport system substrate-binding protein
MPWVPHRYLAADEIAAHLAAVGIDAVLEDGFGFPRCGDYDVVEFTWLTEPGWAGFVGSHEAFDPARPPTPTVFGNVYRWGTPSVEGLADDPNTDWIDESCLNSAPSAVIDEHTERMTAIIADLGGTLDPTNDPETLRSLVAEAEEILADQVVFIPLFVLPRAVMWRDDLAGFGVSAYNLNLLWDCEEWYRADL